MPPQDTSDRNLPLWYYGFAHFCLFTVGAAFVFSPRAIAGFYYHPKMVAVVHLITLGWISSSILGSLLMIGPLTLGVSFPRRRLDRWAFWLFVVGTTGMASHFWIDETSGMVGSAPLVVVALLWVGSRAAAGLRSSSVPAEIRLHFHLAVVNIGIAGALGFLVGLDKMVDVLPGNSLSNVFGHGHLAALGWVLMLVMGAGYRLIPMILPSSMPRGRWVWASALLLEAGVLGLGAAFLFRPGWRPLFGALCIAAVGIFLSRVIWMAGHRKPRGRGLPETNLSLVLVFSALLSLVAATVLGALLALGPEGEWRLSAVTAYATLGLLGFFGQMIAGMGARIVPLFAYLWAPREDGCAPTVPPPVGLASQRLEAATCALWLLAVPLLTLSLAFEWIAWLRLAGALLAAAAAVGLAHHLRVLRRAGWRRQA